MIIKCWEFGVESCHSNSVRYSSQGYSTLLGLFCVSALQLMSSLLRGGSANIDHAKVRILVIGDAGKPSGVICLIAPQLLSISHIIHCMHCVHRLFEEGEGKKRKKEKRLIFCLCSLVSSRAVLFRCAGAGKTCLIHRLCHGRPIRTPPQ